MSDMNVWLTSLGLARYNELFADHHIGMDVVARLTEDHLKELGICVGDRLRLLKGIAAERSEETGPVDIVAREGAMIQPAVPHSPKPPAISTDAERRPLTVMFCDLADSTALSTRLDPEDLQDVIRTYQETCTRMVQEYGGYVAKYMGDGILVYFGYPKSLERNAERAVRSGLAIVGAMAGLNQTVGRDKDIEIAVRIGIATGMVMVGEVVGEGMAQERTVIGEAPNMAARLQGLAGRNGIILGSLTKELSGEVFAYEDTGAHELKGMAGLVQAWRVVGLRGDAAQYHSDRETDGAAEVPELVGRDEETGLLRRAWQSTKDEHRGQVVMISGEAGIGKSVLIDGLKATVRAEGLPRATMRCSPYHAGSALFPVIEHFRHQAGWQPGDDAQTRLAKLESMLGAYSIPIAETVPLFAALLSLPLPDGRFPKLTLPPQQQKQQTQDAIIAITLEAAEGRPLLQLWEDLHWADPSTLELLGLLIEQAPTASLLMVLTARPEFVPPWPARSHITPITLNRLERPHAAVLVARIAGAKPLPVEVVDHIVTKTDGVPLYVEELTKTILASDILREVGDHYELTGPLASLAIPDTLQESLMARLDRLPQVRELAQLGSVLGREFAYEMISGLSTLGDTLLQEGLSQLVDTELLYQRGRPPRARYVFKHALVQDAAYGSLLRRTRQQTHLQVAELLEKRFPETVETHPELMAHHLGEAGQAERAVGFWLKAGQRSGKVSANAEAVGNLRRGLEQVAMLPEGAASDALELELQVALIPPIMVVKGYSAPETKATSERAIALCRQSGQVSRIFPALYGQVAYLYVSGQIVRYQELAAEFLELAMAQPEIVPRLIGLRMMGTSLLAAGSIGRCMDHLEQAWALFDPERDAESALVYGQDLGTGAASYLCIGFALRGFPEKSRDWGQKAVARGRDIEHVNTLCYALLHGALAAYVSGDRTSMELHLDSLKLLTDEHDVPVWRAGALPLQGLALGWQGRPQDGLMQVAQGMEMMVSMQFKLFQSTWSLVRAELLSKLGQAEDALVAIEEGLAITAQTGESWGDAEMHRVRGELLVSASTQDEAEAAFTTALAIAREQGAKWWELRAATSLARLWSLQGKRIEARELLGETYGWFTEGFDTPEMKDARNLLDELT
jgi:class 3 adenylate cyclase/predicted ATPase